MADNEGRPLSTGLQTIGCEGFVTADGGHGDDDIQCDSIKEHEVMDLHVPLITIDAEMGGEDFELLKFLCSDCITVRTREIANCPLDLFEYMKKAEIICENNIDFLLECLGRMHRFDLVRKLGFDPDVIKPIIPSLETIPKFRILLLDIAEDLGEREFAKMKFYLTGKMKVKRLQDSKSAFQLFVIMEQENLLSHKNIALLLEMVKAINRMDLVTQLTGIHGPAVPDSPKHLQATEVIEYKFRVAAENAAGVGKPSELTSSLKPKGPFDNVPNVPPQLPEYKMNRKPRGWCCIINNRDFYIEGGGRDQTPIPSRVGTDKDAESLQHVFQTLGFIVQRRNNLTDTEMMMWMVDVSYNVDHSQFDCFVCCILTHGVLSHLYGSNGKLVSIKDLTATFQTNRCPKLAGKPKLFFLQACQGKDKMSDNKLNGLETDDDQKEFLPNEADFLLGYATVPGYVSFRSRTQGSWYIRKLCELLEKLSAREDLMSILVEVNREVSHANANIDDELFKQTPAPMVTLRKKLYLR